MKTLIIPPLGFCAPFLIPGEEWPGQELDAAAQWLGRELPPSTLALRWPDHNAARESVLLRAEAHRTTNATQPEDKS